MEKTFRELQVQRLEEVSAKNVENLREVIPNTVEEYLQMRYTLSPKFWRQLNEGLLNN